MSQFHKRQKIPFTFVNQIEHSSPKNILLQANNQNTISNTLPNNYNQMLLGIHLLLLLLLVIDYFYLYLMCM